MGEDRHIRSPRLAFVAALLLSASLGTIHAFSVLIEPLESSYQANRGAVSFIYSLALVSLTVAVLLSHRVFERCSPAAIILTVAGGVSFGLLTAGMGDTLFSAILGYGLIFGFANGLGYALALQLAGHAYPDRRGIFMGAVTAIYALGALLQAQFLQTFLDAFGLGGAFYAWAISLVLFIIMAAAAARKSAIGLSKEPAKSRVAAKPLAKAHLAWLWTGYFTGCTAGLMAIGHAAALVSAAGGSAALAALGIVIISLGNGVAGLLAGYGADRFSLRLLMATLPVISIVGLLALAVVDDPAAAIVALGVVGFAYGAIISIYPVAASRFFGLAAGAKAYGIIFTAWGVAGMVGPLMAGHFYDSSGSYALALYLAAGIAVLSSLAIVFMPKVNPT
ncbi:MAG: MFS transporter [Pseudomonadota bacterium]